MARKSKPWFRASKGTWYVKVNGRMTSLHVQGEENEADAIKAWHRLMAGDGVKMALPVVQAKPEPKPEPGKPKTEPTVADVIRGFQADVKDRAKANTVRVYKTFFTPFIRTHGKGKASDLTTVQAEAYSRKQVWSDSTKNAFLGALATAFRWAERARLIDRTPLVGLRRPPKASRGAETLVTEEEHSRLCEAASPAFSLFLQVAYASGSRPGEVAAFSAENFDEANAVVRLKDHKTAHKGQSRTIHLTPEIVALLVKQREKYPSGGPLLRNTKGKPWGSRPLVKAMIATRERAGIPHAVCYGLRHSFATDALANGVPDAHVAELLGHAGTAMLHKHYSHLTEKTAVLKDALGKVR